VVLVDHQEAGEGMLPGGADAMLLKPFSLQEFRDAILVGRKKGLVHSAPAHFDRWMEGVQDPDSVGPQSVTNPGRG
jgi:hypothetical protein